MFEKIKKFIKDIRDVIVCEPASMSLDPGIVECYDNRVPHETKNVLLAIEAMRLHLDNKNDDYINTDDYKIEKTFNKFDDWFAESDTRWLREDNTKLLESYILHYRLFLERRENYLKEPITRYGLKNYTNSTFLYREGVRILACIYGYSNDLAVDVREDLSYKENYLLDLLRVN